MKVIVDGQEFDTDFVEVVTEQGTLEITESDILAYDEDADASDGNAIRIRELVD